MNCDKCGRPATYLVMHSRRLKEPSIGDERKPRRYLCDEHRKGVQGGVHVPFGVIASEASAMIGRRMRLECPSAADPRTAVEVAADWA